MCLEVVFDLLLCSNTSGPQIYERVSQSFDMHFLTFVSVTAVSFYVLPWNKLFFFFNSKLVYKKYFTACTY